MRASCAPTWGSNDDRRHRGRQARRRPRQRPGQRGGGLVEDLGATVAEANPDYPADADVATVAFADDLETAVEDWALYQAPRLRTLVRERDVRTYTYPVPRLQLARETDAAGTAGLEDFK